MNLKNVILSGEELLRKVDRKNKSFFFDGELKDQMLTKVDKKIIEIEAEKEKLKEKNAAKKAAKAADKAARKIAREAEKDEDRYWDEMERQREKSSVLEDVAIASGAEIDYSVVPEEKSANIISLVKRFKKGEAEDTVYVEYTKADASSLLDENLKKFQASLSGQDLLKRNLQTSPLYIEDGKDKLCIEKIYEVESNSKFTANLVFETKNSKFMIEFAVSIKF